MTAPAQRSTCIGALPSNAGRRFPSDRTIFDMLKPMAYHLSPAIDSTMDGERPPPTRRNFSAALEGPTSSLARRNPGQAFWTNPCSGTSLDRLSAYRLLLPRGGRAVQPHTPGSAATSPVSCCHMRMRAARVGLGRRMNWSVRRGTTRGRTTRRGRLRNETKVTRSPICLRDADRRLP